MSVTPIRDRYVYAVYADGFGLPHWIGVGKGDRSHVSALRVSKQLGARATDRKIAENCTRTEAIAIECELIPYYRSIGAPLLNQNNGGGGVKNHSKQTREKMATSMKGKGFGKPSPKRGRKCPEQSEAAREAALRMWADPEYRAKNKTSSGYKHSAETLKKIARIGQTPTKETRAKIAASNTGNKNALGFKQTPEALAKIGAASRARWAARKPPN